MHHQLDLEPLREKPDGILGRPVVRVLRPRLGVRRQGQPNETRALLPQDPRPLPREAMLRHRGAGVHEQVVLQAARKREEDRDPAPHLLRRILDGRPIQVEHIPASDGQGSDERAATRYQLRRHVAMRKVQDLECQGQPPFFARRIPHT